MPGLRKSKIDHMSSGEFSSGVPVSTRRWSAEKDLQVRALTVPGFLMCWASSRMTKSNRSLA